MTFIRLKVSELRAKLAVARQAIASKSSHPTLACYRIECVKRRVTITTGDLEDWIQVSMMAAERYRDGGFCIYADLLDAILPTLGGEDWILFEQANPKPLKILISCGSFKHETPCLKLTEFPDLPQLEDATEVTLQVPEFVGNLTNVSFCVSTDATKQALTGVNLFLKTSGSLFFYATNGHHLAKSCIGSLKGKFESNQSFTLPFRSTVYALKLISALESKDNNKEKDAPPKIESLHLSLTSTHYQISFNEGVLISRLIPAQYPNERVESLFQMKHPAMELELATEALRTELKRLEFTAANRGSGNTKNIIELQFSPNELLVTANSPEFGIGEGRLTIAPRMLAVSSDNKGTKKPQPKPFPEALIVALNIKYLLKWLDTAIAGGVKSVKLRLGSRMVADGNAAVPTGDPDPLSICFFTSMSNPMYQYIIMPLQLQRETVVRITANQGSFEEASPAQPAAEQTPATETDEEASPAQPADSDQAESDHQQLELKAPPARQQATSAARGKKAASAK